MKTDSNKTSSEKQHHLPCRLAFGLNIFGIKPLFRHVSAFQLTALCCVLWLMGCSSVSPVGSDKNRLSARSVPADQINWPTEYAPQISTFTISNSISISAPPQIVWDELIRAEAWPQWYKGAANVKVENSEDGIINEGSTITWQTMDQNLVTKVVEFVPPYRMGWESRQSTLKAYHAWLLIPTAEGTKVVTDESQYGLLAYLQRIFLPNKLRNLHDVWLSELKVRAEESVGGIKR
jgi:uncharacterized protein YndB with AHSA1/START domain